MDEVSARQRINNWCGLRHVVFCWVVNVLDDQRRGGIDSDVVRY